MPPVAYLGKNSEPLVSLASCHLHCSFGFALTAPSATCRDSNAGEHTAWSSSPFSEMLIEPLFSQNSVFCLPCKTSMIWICQCILHWVYWNSGWTALRISPAEQRVMSLAAPGWASHPWPCSQRNWKTGRQLWNSTLWTWQGCCARELAKAVVACTSASQSASTLMQRDSGSSPGCMRSYWQLTVTGVSHGKTYPIGWPYFY